MSPSSRWSRVLYHGKMYLGVLFLQLGYAANGVIVKGALNKGLNPGTFSVYRNIAAVGVFGPVAFYFERNIRPGMTKSVFFKIVLLALLEPVLDQILYYTGMKYTTVTFAITMCNIIPALTFCLAWIFRLESVNIKKLHSQVKIIGTLVTVGGAMVMTLVSGPTFPMPWTNASRARHPAPTDDVSQGQHIKGAIMITIGCFCWAAFFILQAITLNQYPAQLSLTSHICSMGAFQATIITLIMERGKKDIWSIKWDAKLFATLYSGIIRSGAAYYVSGLIMKLKGPFFVTAFNPFGMVIVVIMSSFTLGEQMNLGRVVGACTIVIGLYMIIWGKSKESRSPNASRNGVTSTEDTGSSNERRNGTETEMANHESAVGDDNHKEESNIV